MKVNTGYTSNDLMGTLQKTLKGSSLEKSKFGTMFSEKLNKKNPVSSDEEKTDKEKTEAFELPILNPFSLNDSHERVEEFQNENMDLILNSDELGEMGLGLEMMENSIIHSQGSESTILIDSNSIEQGILSSDSFFSSSSINMEELMFGKSVTSIKNPMEVEGEITETNINLENALDKMDLNRLVDQDSFSVKTDGEFVVELNENEIMDSPDESKSVAFQTMLNEFEVDSSDESKSVAFQTMLNEFEVDSSSLHQVEKSSMSNLSGLSDSQLRWENHNQVVQQISGVIHSLNDGDIRQLNLKLYPKTLGEMQVELTLKNGVLTGVFMVDSNEVKQLVEQTLMQSSLNLTADFNITVDVNSRGSSENLFSFNKDGKNQESSSRKTFTSTEKANARSQQAETLTHGYQSQRTNIRLIL